MAQLRTATSRTAGRFFVALVAAIAVTAVLLLSNAGRAHAQTVDPSCLSMETGYDVCASPAVESASVLGTQENRGQTLPVTGGDSSKYAVVGAVFVILGGAAVVGARRARPDVGQ